MASENKQPIFNLIVGHDEVVPSLIARHEPRLTHWYPNLVLVIKKPHIAERTPFSIDTSIYEEVSSHKTCLMADSRSWTNTFFWFDFSYVLNHVSYVLSFSELALIRLIYSFDGDRLLDDDQIVAEFIDIGFWVITYCFATEYIVCIHQVA